MAVDAEVHRIEQTSTLAKQRIGLLSIVLMWNLFQSVNPDNPAQTYGQWFFRALRVSRAAAFLMRGLAKSQYRLTRALDTGGGTVAWTEDDALVRELGELRQEYVDKVEDALELGSKNNSLPDDEDVAYFNDLISDMKDEFAELAERLSEKETRSAEAVRDLGGADRVTEDSLKKSSGLLSDLLDDMLNDPSLPNDTAVEVDLDFSDLDERDRDYFDQFFEDSENELRDEIRKAYIDRLDEMVERPVSEEWTLEDARNEIRELADEIGLNASAWLQRLANEQGRLLAERTAAKDDRQLMAARKTGSNPCSFCAMLASRGYVYTKTTAAGTSRRIARSGNKVDASQFDASGFRSYHPNCQCSVVYRWQDTPQADAVSGYLSQLYHEAGDMRRFRRMLDEIRRERGGSLNLYF